MSGRLAKLRTTLLGSPWPLTLGLLVPFTLLMGWVQWEALSRKVLARGVMELWVHGRQPGLEWVPFIHPPGYALFMNATDTTAGWWGISPELHVLLGGWACRVGLVVLVAWAMNRWTGPIAALLAAALVALSPNGLRAFEHYPLATLLGTAALVAIVELARVGDRRSAILAVAAVSVAVQLHLSTWFVVGGAMATVFFVIGERRKVAFRASVAMIGLFMLTTFTGLWEVLRTGQGEDMERSLGQTTIEWTNPALLGLLALWLVPPLFRRAREGAALAGGAALFTGVTLWLQRMQYADGQPYPYSLHYFELIDPTLAVTASWALHLAATAGSPGRVRRGLVGAVAAGLLVSQGYLLLQGQEWIFLNKFWFWVILWPFGA